MVIGSLLSLWDVFHGEELMMVVGGIVVPVPVLVKRGPRSVIRAGTFWAQVFGSIDSQGTINSGEVFFLIFFFSGCWF